MRIKTILLLPMTLCLLSVARSQETNALVPTQTITLPNLKGGFNHMSVDAEHHRHFAAAPANGTVEILDLDLGKPVRTLKGGGPAAARYAP